MVAKFSTTSSITCNLPPILLTTLTCPTHLVMPCLLQFTYPRLISQIWSSFFMWKKVNSIFVSFPRLPSQTASTSHIRCILVKYAIVLFIILCRTIHLQSDLSSLYSSTTPIDLHSTYVVLFLIHVIQNRFNYSQPSNNTLMHVIFLIITKPLPHHFPTKSSFKL